MGTVTIRLADLTALQVPAYLASRPGSDDRMLVLDANLGLRAADELINEMLTPDELLAARWVCGCYELPAVLTA